MKVTVEDGKVSYTAETDDGVLFQDFVEQILKPAVCAMYSEFLWDQCFGGDNEQA
jgi:hypothetical protein